MPSTAQQLLWMTGSKKAALLSSSGPTTTSCRSLSAFIKTDRKSQNGYPGVRRSVIRAKKKRSEGLLRSERCLRICCELSRVRWPDDCSAIRRLQKHWTLLQAKKGRTEKRTPRNLEAMWSVNDRLHLHAAKRPSNLQPQTARRRQKSGRIQRSGKE